VSVLNPTQVVSIVDDDDAVRVATASLVRSLGWPTRVFASAEEFLQSADIEETACLISDVRMTGMSGVEMYERLVELGCAPPTIFVTAFPTAALEARICANGALACLEKPVDAAAIAHCLARIFGET
jgi:FixJ family two-component response regulator